MGQSGTFWPLSLSVVLCVALATAQARGSDTESVVVLELFTSQGCSSCPPADELLREIKARWGDRVIPLAFHVDYWTYLGWRDPFSSSDWTERQERYAAAVESRRIYTPQLVVAGNERLVGSRRGEVVASIERALDRSVALKASLRGRFGDDGLTACVANGFLHPDARLYVAIFEDGLVTPVPRGENAGRTLRNDFVVRKLVRVDDGSRIRISSEQHWKAENLGAVAFWQNAEDLRIYGAAALNQTAGAGC